MAKFEEIGVIAVVDGFEAFVLKLTSMNRNVRKFGAAATTASGGVAALGVAFRAIAIAGAAAVAIIGAIAVGITKLTINSIQTAASFETAFAGVLKTTNNLGTNLYDLTDAGEAVFQQFRDLSKEIPLSFEELATIGEFAGQLGIPESALADFTRTVAALGASTQLSTEDAALGLARIANVYGITADEMASNTERLGSTIVYLGNNFNALEPEILTFARMMSGTAAAVNISQSELLAISTAFVSAGVNAEAGGSSIQRVLLEMSSAVQTGGTDLRKWADATGLTAQEFADAWGSEGGPARVFNQFVQELSDAGEGASLILEDLDVDTIRVLRTFLAGAGAADVLDEALVGAADAWDANTALAREASIRYETLDSKVDILHNRFRDMGATLGLMLVPAITDFIDQSDPFVAAIESKIGPAFETILTSVQENLLPALGNLAGAIFGVDFSTMKPEDFATGVLKIGDAVAEKIEDFSKFVDKMAELVTLVKDEGLKEGIVIFAEDQGIDPDDIQKWIDGFKVFGIAILGIAAAFAAAFIIANPLAIIIGVVVGLVIAFWDKIVIAGTALKQLFLIIAMGIAFFIRGLAEGIATIPLLFEKVKTDIATKWEEIKIAITEKIEEIKTNIATKWEEIKTGVSTKWEEIKTAITDKIEEIKTSASEKWDEFKETVSNTWDSIKEGISSKWEEIIEEVTTWIDNTVEEISGKLDDFVQLGRDIVAGIVDGIIQVGGQIYNAIWAYIESALARLGISLESNSPSKLFAREIGEPMSQGVAMGIENEGTLPEAAMMESVMGTVNAAEMLLPSSSYTTTNTDRSFNMGDIYTTTMPEETMTMADRIAMMAMIQSGG